MNKLAKLLLIPIALTLAEGCAPFHNAIRNIRHNLERIAKKKDPNRRKLVAHGFECGNVVTATRKAISEARQQLRGKGIHAEIETIPKAPKEIYWPDVDSRRECVIAVAYEDSKPAPKTKQPTAPIPPTITNETLGSEIQ
ncbi:hypothetical protein ACFL6I_23275 [candidate division KSB1 bacterium]